MGGLREPLLRFQNASEPSRGDSSMLLQNAHGALYARLRCASA